MNLDRWWQAVGTADRFRFVMRNDEAVSLRIRLLRVAGRNEEADACQRVLHEAATRTLGADHPRTLEIGAAR